MTTDIIFLFFSTIFVHNILANNLLGLCPVLGTSSSIKLSTGMGLATTIVRIFTIPVCFMFSKYVLKAFDLLYLQSLFMIMIIAFSVNSLEILIKNISPVLYTAIGIYFPLITSNCAILGAGIIVLKDFNNLFDATLFSLFAGLGFFFILIMISFIRVRLETQPSIKKLQGYPQTFTIIGILAMCFLGFS